MSEPAVNHPGDETLRALSLGQLRETELVDVSAHLDGCPACCCRIDQLASGDRLLARLQDSDARRETLLVNRVQRRAAVRALRRSSDSGVRTDSAQSSIPISQSAIPKQVGDYEILTEVGRGGMGVVYKARHRGLQRLAALKMVLAGEFASHAQELRFRLEAELAARVQHPNIVQVYEIGSYEGRPFLAMEWIEGGSLADRLGGKPWPPGEAAALVETLARAIDVAHGEGVVHRDLKPANILIQESGVRNQAPEVRAQQSASAVRAVADSCRLPPDSRPKITDFGLAKLLESDRGQTESRMLLGTPTYSAPEQMDGNSKSVGPSADVYALGAILHEVLTGRPPFKGSTVLETVRQVIHEEPVPPRLLTPAIPRDLEVICLKCLEKKPAQRYASAAALAEDLRRWRNHEPILARPPTVVGRAVRWSRRHPAVTTVVFVMALGLAGVFWQWRDAESQREAAVTAGQLAEERRVIAEKLGRDAMAARKDAEEEAAAAREVANFMGGLFEEADPLVLSGRTFGEQPNSNPTAMEIVERGAKRLADPSVLKDKPLVRATLLDKVGHVFMVWGQVAKAEPFVLEALKLRKKHENLPAVQADLAASLHNVGFLHIIKGNHRKSKEYFAAAIELRGKLFGSRNALTMSSRFHLGLAHFLLLERAEAERLLVEVADFQREQFEKALAKKSSEIGKEALEGGFTLLILTSIHVQNGNIDKGVAGYAELLDGAKLITNKQFAAMMTDFLNARLAWTLGQTEQADEAFRKVLQTAEKTLGKHHYLYTSFDLDYGNFLVTAKMYAEAEQKFLSLETSWRKSFGDDGLRLADVYYNISRSIERGSLKNTSPTSDPERHKELSAKVVRYARAAYDQARKYDAEKEQMGILEVYLCHALIHYEVNPDYAAIEAIAREARVIREKLYGVGNRMDTHPLNYLIVALARQNKIEEVEKIFLDLLARHPRPEWDVNAHFALPEAAAKLSCAGKTKTAVQMLEHAATTGHFDLNSVRTDAAFAPLRESPDYQELLKKMKSPK
jgi:serine/threonine protein kinase/tetratricopeptide (TPR) repeat protein